MILTVTINPLLERRLRFKSFEPGNVNRTNHEYFYAGGKGINVSRQLNKFGLKNLAITFLGGHNGKNYRNVLTNENINFIVISTKSETRIATLIEEEDNKRITTFIGSNSEISKKESDDFKTKLEKVIQNCSIVIFSGSSPSTYTDDIFPYGIELANKYDKISILDTYGRHFKDCIASEPTVIHNNVNELESSLNHGMSTEDEKLHFLKSLYSQNIKMGFIGDGAKPMYASKFDFHYKIIPPKIEALDATGSGDAFVAGLTYGMEKALVFEDFSKTATVLGALNATKWDACNVDIENLEEYKNLVRVEPLGKKMKLIDDTARF
ncbi:MAG: 1-phosphofructokinase [Melioribacteraceae bacterium]|nr:1-phosphofructokinase [Melioribacteraceae bacterium]